MDADDYTHFGCLLLLFLFGKSSSIHSHMRFEIDIDGGSQFLISVGVALCCGYTSFLNTCKTYLPNSLRDSFFLST